MIRTIRFTSLAPIIGVIGLLGLLVFPPTLCAQVNQFRCPHGIVDGADGTGKCRLCSEAYEEERRRKAKKAKEDREEAAKKAEKDRREAEEKAEKDRREAEQKADEDRRAAKKKADDNAASRINDQVGQARKSSPLRQFNSQSWDDQHKTLLNSDPSALNQTASELKKRAQELSDRSTEALRNGDYATSSALSSAASELSSQASTARNLGFRATSEQQNEKRRIESEARQAESDRKRPKANAPATRARSGPGAPRPTFGDEVAEDLPDAVFESVRDGIEEETGLRTRVPGEALLNRTKEYMEEAEGRFETVSPLGEPIARYIETEIGPQVDRLLNNPNAQPHRPKENGGSGYIAPPIRLPSLASPPYESRPMTEQEVDKGFDRLIERARTPSKVEETQIEPLQKMRDGLEPTPTPSPQPAEPSVTGVFKGWLERLNSAPSPTPTPKPAPSQPKDLLGSPTKR